MVQGKKMRCVELGMLTGGKWDHLHDISRRVYSVNGLCPTLHTMSGGNTEIKIAVPSMGGDMKLRIRDNTAKGYTEAEEGDAINLAFPTSTTRRGRVGKGIAHCLTAQDAQQAVIVRRGKYLTAAMRGRNPANPSDRRAGIELQQRVEIGGEIANCITTVQKDSLVAEPIAQILRKRNERRIKKPLRLICRTAKQTMWLYRIRKLTPRECGRLQGLKDAEIDRIAANASDSAQYHMYGDSIAVTVLMAIFGQIIPGTNSREKIQHFDYKKETNKQ